MSSNNFVLFSNDPVFLNFFNENVKICNRNIITTEDWSQFCSYDGYKITYLFDENYNPTFDRGFEYKKYIEQSNHFFISSPECSWEWIQYIKKTIDLYENITFFINGDLNSLSNHPKLNSCIFWINKTTNFYKKIGLDYFDNLNPYLPKPYYFDFLPGIPKEHRLQTSRYIEKNNLQHKIFSTPFFNSPNWREIKIDYSDENYWEDNIELLGENYNYVKFKGEYIPASIIVPTKIYNKSAYSIVAETMADHETVFLSEKTVKPLLAKRLFITMGCKNHLKNLKKLGFKTFDTIFDEGYDNIFHPNDRVYEAFQQVKWLCTQNQEEILEKIKPIVEYNFNLVINYNAYTVIMDKILETTQLYHI